MGRDKMQQSKLMVWVWPAIVAVAALVIAVMVANSQTSSKLNTVDRSQALWAIQPGLGTVMVEYSNRFGNSWWAADAGNWDMVNYQLKEMVEIQEVGETTRPGRADGLKKFEADDVEPLIEAAHAKDMEAFVAAYDKAITGCNKCHGDQEDSDGNSFKFVKITRPTSMTPFSNVDWKGSQ
jgi:hypothetical protein